MVFVSHRSGVRCLFHTGVGVNCLFQTGVGICFT